MDKIMITFHDMHGAPRAWAAGPASDPVGVELHARAQLAAYCKKKADVGDLDLADPDTYTMRMEGIPG